MKDLITEAREIIEALHAGEYDDEYIGTGAYLMLDELCDALEKAEEQNKQLMHELCKLAYESVEREKALAKLEGEVMARLRNARRLAVPVVRGRWIAEQKGAEYCEFRCSVCDDSIGETDQFDETEVKQFSEWYKYCPMCGARMEDK